MNPMTMTQKILANAAGRQSVRAGELVSAEYDLALGSDITAPIAIDEIRKNSVKKLYCPDRIALVNDHFAPARDIASAELGSSMRRFAADYHVGHFYDVGESGIEHTLLPEQGLVVSGDCVIGADSHTVTYGALGAFSTGVGSTDLAYAMATGKTWFKIPSAVKVVLNGSLPANVCGKDVILKLISLLGVDGATYKSLEFCGDGVASLSMDDRFTICNMSVEAGAKNGIFPVDNKTLEYISTHSTKTPKIFSADPDAEYDDVISINLDELRPLVAFPSLPSNVVTVSEAATQHIRLNQVVIGCCTNGRYSDMAAAANILKNKKAAPGLRLIIVPATRQVYSKCLRDGLIEIFLNAGAVISPPTCGVCFGGHLGVLAEGEKCLSTTNRNFVGRMGHVKSEIYLSSPYVAAASAVVGEICDPTVGGE